MSEKIHWSHCLGNPFSNKPDGRMIRSDGLEIERNVSIRGESKFRRERKETRTVVYDREYLISYFAVKYGAFFNAIPQKELEKLVKESKQRYRENKS